MSNNQYRYTESASSTIKIAHDCAAHLKHNYLGTEHLLFGLIKEGAGVAARVLYSQNVTDKIVLNQIERIIGHGNQPSSSPLPYTPRTKKVFELANSEAHKLNQNLIGTEHLLIGLMLEGESVAVRILVEIGVDIRRLYESLMDALDIKIPVAVGKEKEIIATPTLDKYGNDLTKKAEDGAIDPIIGRDKEIERIIQILSRRTKNNPCIIGDPGVGKTAVCEGLAQKIVEGDIPETLKGKRLVNLDLSSMVAGAKYRGEFEERLKKTIEEIIKANNVILFIDEMHTIIGAGSAEGSIDAANILKPKLARGEIQIIGATTLNEYRKYVEKDAALERRFQPIMVDEPSQEEAVLILKGVRDVYEAHHKVTITDEAIAAAVTLSNRYITDRFLPDKAIDLIDEAASKIRLMSFTIPPDIKKLEADVEAQHQKKEEAIINQEYELAANIRDQENEIKKILNQQKENWEQKNQISKQMVKEDDIADIVGAWTGIPVKRLAQKESERLKNLENILHESVVGQDEAIISVSKAIRRGRVGLKDPNRPVGSFIFLGPTGVGKTELCRTLADVLFENQKAFIRVDMSEYMEKHSVSKMIGSPPGYVGFDDGGQLTERIRRNPYAVVLFDEIEKAHPDVFNMLLQILEDGRLTDSSGRLVDFRNAVLIMTSNVGARNIVEPKKLGFSHSDVNSENEYKDMKNNVMTELKKQFRPEFINRVDDIIVFHALKLEHIVEIARLMLKDISDRLKAKKVTISLSTPAIEFLANKGYDKVYGARPLRRVIQELIEDRLAEELLDGSINDGDSIEFRLSGEKLEIRKKRN